MATDTTLADAATLGSVMAPDDGPETTGQRIARRREELGWRQVDLAAASGVKVATISNIERDLPAKRGERPSVSKLEETIDAEHERRAAQDPARDAERVRVLYDLLMEEARDLRMERIGRHQKTRYITFALPDPDATPEQIRQDLEDFHRQQRRDDPPKG
jgi:transcriptional regulator with XRE-family HTH domain